MKCPFGATAARGYRRCSVSHRKRYLCELKIVELSSFGFIRVIIYIRVYGEYTDTRIYVPLYRNLSPDIRVII